MIKKATLLGAVLIAAASFAGSPASAASAIPQSTPLVLMEANGLVTKAHYGYCRHWYRVCRYRWGFGWRFRRCMRIRGC